MIPFKECTINFYCIILLFKYMYHYSYRQHYIMMMSFYFPKICLRKERVN